MRQIFVIVSLLFAMLGLKSLGLESGSGFDPIFLAALGFVVLAAFSSAEIVGKLNLPKVTGFILIGIVLGPQVADVLSERIVSETKMFTTLALGLIALSAGLELHVSSLKKVSKALTYTIVLKLLLLFTFVLGGFYAALNFFETFDSFHTGEKLAFSLIFSALSLGTSPSIVLALINETKIKSRMVDITLGMAVLKDVLVVLALAVCLALSKTMTDVGASFSPDILIRLGEEIGLSIAVGGLLGCLLILYLRFVKLEMLLFVTLVVLAVAEVSAALHLELLLVFIVAGFVVSNFSKYEHDLLKPLEKVALPVFIIFFTNAGAGLNFVAMQKILPIAVVLCVLRAVAFYISGYFGAKLAGENVKVAKNSWLCYIPQAGVTLGLVGIAASQMTNYSELIQNIGMGMVGINLLIGPITLRMGFAATAETPIELNETAENSEANLNKAGRDLSRLVVSEELELIKDKYFMKRILDFEKTLEEHFLKPSLSLLENFYQRSEKGGETQNQRIARFEKISDLLFEKVEYFEGLRVENIDSIKELPQVTKIKLSAKWKKFLDEDSKVIKLRKIRLKVRMFFSRNKQQNILIRACFRKHLYSYYLQNEKMLVQSWLHTLFLMNHDLSKNLKAELSNEETHQKFQENLNDFILVVTSQFKKELQYESDNITHDLYYSGTPYLPEKDLKFSNFESESKSLKNGLNQDVKVWKEIFKGHRNYLKLSHQLIVIKSVFMDTIEKKINKPLNIFTHTFESMGEGLSKNLEEIVNIVSKDSLEDADRAKILDKFDKQRFFLETLRAQSERIVDSGFEKNVLVSINNIRQLNESQRVLSTKYLLNASPKNVKFSRVRLSDNLMLKVEGKLLSDINMYVQEVYQTVIRLVQEVVDQSEKLNLRSSNLENFNSEEIENFKSDLKDEIENTQKVIEDNLATLVSAAQEFNVKSNASSDEVFKDIESLETKDVYLTKTNSNFQRFYKDQKTYLKNTYTQFAADFKKALTVFSISKRKLQTSNELKRLRKSVLSNDLDSSTIELYLKSVHENPYIKDLSQSYIRLFADAPLYDDRLALKIDNIIKSKKNGTRKILIVGGSGSGKTSLTNILSTKLKAQVLEIKKYTSNDKTLVERLSFLLGVDPQPKAILTELRSKQYTVIVDDINSWWEPLRIKDFDEFLDIVSKSGHRTNWIVSINSRAFAKLRHAFEFSSVFDEIDQLPRLISSEIEDFVEKRNKYSGVTISYPSTVKIKSLQNLIKEGNKRLFHQYLFELSNGNYRVLNFLWLKSISNIDEEEVHLSFSRAETVHYDFLNEFSDSKMFLLDELVSYKSRSLSVLHDSLGFDETTISRDITFLESSGLIVRDNRGAYSVKSHLEPGVENFLNLN
jgi:Kef-type K+ transport system membrane component KefB/adenylate kinase family enzyme